MRIMETTDIRHKPHKFIDTAEDKKAELIYILFKNEIEQNEWEYPDEFKAEPDKRYKYYQSGGEMISAAEADYQIKQAFQSEEKK